jgi:hypothetical protein
MEGGSDDDDDDDEGHASGGDGDGYRGEADLHGTGRFDAANRSSNGVRSRSEGRCGANARCTALRRPQSGSGRRRPAPCRPPGKPGKVGGTVAPAQRDRAPREPGRGPVPRAAAPPGPPRGGRRGKCSSEHGDVILQRSTLEVIRCLVERNPPSAASVRLMPLHAAMAEGQFFGDRDWNRASSCVVRASRPRVAKVRCSKSVPGGDAAPAPRQRAFARNGIGRRRRR